MDRRIKIDVDPGANLAEMVLRVSKQLSLEELSGLYFQAVLPLMNPDKPINLVDAKMLEITTHARRGETPDNLLRTAIGAIREAGFNNTVVLQTIVEIGIRSNDGVERKLAVFR